MSENKAQFRRIIRNQSEWHRSNRGNAHVASLMRATNGFRLAAICAATALAYSICCPDTVLAQDAGVTGLPKLLVECDIPPAGAVCGTWTLDDGHYDGVWPNGAIAQMTVDRFDKDAIIIRRVDVSGTFPGMHATYTGKWDGRAAKNATVTWSFGGYSGSNAWSATLPSPDSSEASTSTSVAITGTRCKMPSAYVAYLPANNGNGDAYPAEQIMNTCSVPLVAWDVTIDRVYPETTLHDVVLTGRELPLTRGQSYFRRLADTMAGITHLTVSINAALFSDGTVISNLSDGATLFFKARQDAVRSWEGVAPALCAIARNHSGKDAVDKAFLTEDHKRLKYLNLGTVYSRLSQQADPASHVPKLLRNALEVTKRLVAEPIRSPSGKILRVVAHPAVLECNV